MIFQQITGLGPTCRSKFQIKRFYGKHIAKRGVFDGQITPESALVFYLKADFRGVFERSDLVIDENGVVTNSRTGTKHPHEFPKNATEEDLHSHYWMARRKHDDRCSATRSSLTNKVASLLVLGAPVSVETRLAIADYIASASPRKRYLIIEEALDRSEDWWGTDAVWDEFLSPYEVQPTYTAKVEYELYRLRRSWEYLLPKPLRLKLLAREQQSGLTQEL